MRQLLESGQFNSFTIEDRCFRSVLRAMSSNTSSGKRPEHLDRTASEARSDSAFGAVIAEVKRLSPTVKGFTFKVDQVGLNLCSLCFAGSTRKNNVKNLTSR